MKKIICTNCDDWQNCEAFILALEAVGWDKAVDLFCDGCINAERYLTEVKDSIIGGSNNVS